MNGLPYYKRYPRDFFEGTIGMPLELKGPYSLVVDLIYMQNGNLPDDARYISGLLGCGVRQWNGIREKLIGMGKIQTRDGYLGNFRADKELVSSHLFQDKQRANGAKGGKNNGLPKAVAKPKSSQSEPESEEVKREAKASPKNKPSRLPENWFLPMDWGRWAMDDQGLHSEQIHIEAEKFKDYWMARAGPGAVKADWQATWRNWIRAAKQRGFSNGRQPTSNAIFGATINQLANDLSAGTITLDNSRSDPFAAQRRGNA